MYKLFALINGNWINILPKSNNLTWGDDKDTLSVELNFDGLYDIEEGTHIIMKNDDTELFNGIIVKKAKKHFGNSFTCFDMGFYLNKNKTIKQFNEVVASEAITQLCNDFGINCNITYIGAVITKVYKDQTISEIIEDILSQAINELGIKYVKEIDGYTLKIRPLTDLVISPKILVGKDITVNSSLENMKNSVLVVSGEDDNVYVAAKAQDSNNINKYGILQEVMSVDADNITQAQNIANNFLTENNRIFKDTSLPLLAISGGDDIKANRLINFSLPTMGLNGLYRIKSTNHTLTNNNHKVSIDIEW